MSAVPEITPEDVDVSYLRERLQANPERGTLTWLPNPLASRGWNTRWAGKPAFTACSKGYLIGRLDGRLFKAHRVLWAIATGAWPKGFVDHINGDRKDNRLINLRVVAAVDNARNQKLRVDSTSGCTGVSWASREGKWRARIMVDYREIHIGYFSTYERALCARTEANRRYGFHENHGRDG